jgi:hypothetical protein
MKLNAKAVIGAFKPATTAESQSTQILEKQ